MNGLLLLVSLFAYSHANVINIEDVLRELASYDDVKEGSSELYDFSRHVSPTNKLKSIGQVGGIALLDQNLVVFHRASRTWNFDSFRGNTFNHEDYGSIQENVLTVVDRQSLTAISAWGKNMTYMPHGLYIDHEDNIWITDVGTHQVYKFDLYESKERPALVLGGKKFEHSSRDGHFCKPTSVAVDSRTGHIFVADGYCNHRIAVFDQHGKFIMNIQDAKQPLIVVHSIALIEKENLVCTVSREEGRIVCFDIKTGDKKLTIQNPEMKTCYAIAYNKETKCMHAVTGENHMTDSFGITFDLKDINKPVVLGKWSTGDLDLADAHDMAVSKDGQTMYTGQLNGQIDEFSN